MYEISNQNDYFELLELIKNSSPRFPEYTTFLKRLQSLNEFPSLTIDKLQLADAGFFLKTKDWVQCWFCGVTLGQWRKGDCIFREHARFSRNCPFVLLKKGSEFVKNVNNKFKYNDLNSYCACNHTLYDEIDG